MPIRLLLILVSFSLVTSCGFQLRGNLDNSNRVNLISQLAQVYIAGDDPELVERLSDLLFARGINIVDSKTGNAIINLSTNQFQRSALTTDISGQASAYTFRYEVVVTVTAHDGEELQAAQTISVERAYHYDSTKQLQADEETRFLKTSMRDEVIEQILWKLAN